MQQLEDDYWGSSIERHDPSFVALDTTGKKLGTITLKLDDTEGSAHGWRFGIGVKTEVQDQGIGQLLIEQAIVFAKEAETDYMNLHVDSANTRAIALYQRLGQALIDIYLNILYHV